MTRKLFWLVLPALVFAAQPATADTIANFVGNVNSATSKNVYVKAGDKTQTFILGTDFTGVYGTDGKKLSLSALKAGKLVKVTYRNQALLETFHAIRIDLLPSGGGGMFNLNGTLQAPPTPQLTPPPMPASPAH